MIKSRSLKLKYRNYVKRIISYFCRQYARIQTRYDRRADPILSSLTGIVYYLEHGYVPHFKNPRTFSEKVFSRMLYSRKQILTDVSDKLKVREYVSQRIGNRYFIPLLWQGENPDDIPFELLPSRLFIKTNHGCGYNIPVRDIRKYSPHKIRAQLRIWLRENFCTDSFLGIHWAYKNIKPMIMIEEFLEENGKPPLDYKFFCFSGRVEYLLIVYDRFASHQEKHFTRDFVPLDLWNGADQYPGPFIRPYNLEEMIKVAETLSAGFDFIRVDLYNVNGKIYFGELTCYPAGGLAAFVPRKWDFIFGEKWILENKYK